MASPVPPPPDLVSSEQGAATMNNDPVGGLRSWERAWAVDEMRKEAGNWSLAADAGLLLHLQEFSQRMILRVHEIEKGVDGLLNDSKLTSVRVNNVFNDFIMLANTQFVENRVYDEDVSQEGEIKEETKPDEQEKTREQREAELIPKVKEALTLGINVIDEAFEKLDSHVADSDSEDDDETGYRVDPILEPKDPYLSRPLPLLIGTPNFLADDNVGLLEEESEEEESDHGSMSESESEDEKKEEASDEYSYSDSDSDSDSDAPRSKPPPRKITKDSSDETDDSDGDMFGGKGKNSDDEEDDETEDSDEAEFAREKEAQSKGPTDFASELAKKIGVPAKTLPPGSDEDGDDEFVDEPKAKTKGKEKKRTESESSHKKSKKSKDKSSKKKTPDDDADLFGAPEEEDSPFGTSGGLFSSGKSMFDNDSDEGGLFDDMEKEAVIEEEKPRKKSSSIKKPAGGVALFGEEDDGMFGSSTKERSDSDKKATSISAPSIKKGGGGGFFDDDDDEDEDAGVLFAPSSKKTSEVAKAPSKSALFDDEDEEGDLFGSGPAAKQPEEKKKPEKTKPEKKLPAGAVSMFGSGPNPLSAALKKQRPVSDEEDSDASAGNKSRSSSVKSSQSQSSLSSRQVDRVKKDGRSSSSNSLFDEDADDALFRDPLKPRADSKSKAKPAASLFGADDDEDDGLFGMGKKPAAKALVTEKPRSGSLFGEDQEDGDMFGGAAAKSTASASKKPVGGVSLFGGVDILGKKKADTVPVPVQTQEPPKTQAPKQSSLSLFDGNEEEEGDLFGGGVAVATKAPQAKPTATAGGKRDLFGDEDVLFGGVEEQSPGVNLFGTPGSPGTSPAKSSPVQSKGAPTPKAPVAKVTQKPSSGLFDDNDDEDMFGSPAPKVRADSGVTLPVAGVTTEESTDSPKKKEAPKSRKPVGGVSIMGGIDPFAIKQRRHVSESEEEDVVPKKTEVKEPPKPSLSASVTKPSLSASVTKPSLSASVTKKADPMFGDEDDDLFTVSKPSPQPSIKPPQIKKTEDVFSPNKPAHTSVPKPSPLSMDDDEDDDLFGRKPPPVQNDPPAKSRGGDLFGSSPSSESDLFGSSPPAVEEPQAVSPKVKKPPAGAVSMFGGLDPFAAMKKKQTVESEKTTDDSGEKPSASVPHKETSTKGREIPSPTKERQPSSPTKGFPPSSPTKEFAPSSPTKGFAPSSPTKGPEQGFPTKGATGKIGKLKMNIGINPAALLPGAAPPVKEPEPVAIGFDAPAEVKTLHSASKDRARIQTKRRPPSRVARHSQGDSSSGDLFSPMSPPGGDITKETPKNILNDRVPQPTSDLFGNDDLLVGGSTIPVKPAPIIEENDIFSSGTFSSSTKVTKSKKVDEDDLFGSPAKSVVKSATRDDIFDASSNKLSKKPSAILTNDDDDLFASKSSTKAAKSAVVDDIFSPPKVSKQFLNDDDLFPSKSGTKTDTSQVLPSSERSKNDSQGDGDIFGGASTPKQEAKKSVVEKEQMNNDDIFAGATDTVKKVEKPNQDEDDELFGKPVEKKKRQVKKAPKTKDEDLFNDNTDIFANVPASKPKEKKKKKTATGGSKSLFKDTDGLDDIFGGTKPKTKTAKTEKAKKTTTAAEKKTAADSNDIFDDPLGNM